MEPLLSVIIPVYNVENYIEQCVDSVLNQDYGNYEIILIDDGSTDGSGAKCDIYADRYSNIRVIHQVNGGLSDARNRGIIESSGEYVIFLDSDDYWNRDCSLAKIMNCVITKPELDLCIFGGRVEFDGKRAGSKNKETLEAMCRVNDTDIKYVYKCFAEANNLFEAAYIKLIKRRLIIDNSLFFKKGIIAEDNEWSFRLYRVVSSIGFVNEDLYVYRAGRIGSISNTPGIKHIKSMMTIIELSQLYYSCNPEKINAVGKYELGFCAYLWLISAGIFGTLNLEKRKECFSLLNERKSILKYAYSRKVKICRIMVGVFGTRIASILLKEYLNARRNRRF